MEENIPHFGTLSNSDLKSKLSLVSVVLLLFFLAGTISFFLGKSAPQLKLTPSFPTNKTTPAPTITPEPTQTPSLSPTQSLPTSQLKHVPILPTTDWKTVSNDGVSFKIPPGATCDNDNLCTKVTYVSDYQGHSISSYIYVSVFDYRGGSKREEFLKRNTEVADCRPLYEEALFGNVKALQIAVESGRCQSNSGGIVTVVGNKLVIIGGGLAYDPKTKVIGRWPIRDTLISTLRGQ
jgi:hypothetical protein